MKQSMSNVAPRRFSKLLVVIIGVFLSLVAAEVLLRVTGVGTTSRTELFGGTLPKLAPYSSYLQTRENVNWVEVNNWGFKISTGVLNRMGFGSCLSAIQ